jgi:hypothetical protein
MALAMRVSELRDSGTYTLVPLVTTQISRAGSGEAKPLDIASLFRHMAAPALPACCNIWREPPVPSRRFTFGTWSDENVSKVDDYNQYKYLLCLLTVACHYEETGPQVGPHGQQRAAVAPYAVAAFIQPLEYAWNLDFFAAEEALKVYLNDSHADH